MVHQLDLEEEDALAIEQISMVFPGVEIINGRNGARNLCALISPYYNISTSLMVKPVT